MEFLLRSFFVFIIALLITLYLVPIFIQVARKFGIMDSPDGKLKNHKEPTPYLGGLAIYLGFVTAVSLAMPFEHRFFLFILVSTILVFLGLLDDLVALTPGQKFFGQFIATLCYLKAGFYLKISFFGNIWNIAISALWCLVMINAFNLIDVMDGLATLTAVCVASTYLMFALLAGQQLLALFLLAFIGALCAFLWFNRPPAKMYLGDSGSLFLGGFLACIPFTISWSECNAFGYLVPVVISAIPLLELGTLILVRTYKKIPFYYGSPDHFSIYLRNKGWKKETILFYIVALSVILAFISVLFFYSYVTLSTLCTLAVGFLMLWYGMFWWR